MANIKALEELADWESNWAQQKAADASPLRVFKFSPICPTSHFVENIVRKFIGGRPESNGLRIVSVDVVQGRPISQRIAADTHVKHESPQALLICGGQAICWHGSHGAIDADTLQTALTKAGVKP